MYADASRVPRPTRQAHHACCQDSSPEHDAPEYLMRYMRISPQEQVDYNALLTYVDRFTRKSNTVSLPPSAARDMCLHCRTGRFESRRSWAIAASWMATAS